MKSALNVSQTSSLTKLHSPKSLSNETLLRNTQALVSEERKLTTEILWHLHEIQVRRLYAEKGYGSLFEYTVQTLGYSEAAAGRRIAAMRLLVDVPEIEPALRDGSVSLSTLSTIQSFVQRKEKPISKPEKRELVFSLQGKSRRECEKHLIALDPLAALPSEKERVVSPTQTEIRFIADDELMQKLQKIREHDRHVTAGASYLELFHRMADLALKKLDPLSKKQIPSQSSNRPTPHATSNSTPPKAVSIATPPAESKNEKVSRYVSTALKREIWQRDHGQCTYQSVAGKKCSSRYALEIDHIVPLALGGKTESSNLRLLCRGHNQHQAFQKLGDQTMLPFMRY